LSLARKKMLATAALHHMQPLITVILSQYMSSHMMVTAPSPSLADSKPSGVCQPVSLSCSQQAHAHIAASAAYRGDQLTVLAGAQPLLMQAMCHPKLLLPTPAI
jgi:hypothetical protein